MRIAGEILLLVSFILILTWTVEIADIKDYVGNEDVIEKDSVYRELKTNVIRLRLSLMLLVVGVAAISL